MLRHIVMTTKEMNGGEITLYNSYFGKWGVKAGEYDGKRCIALLDGDQVRLHEMKADTFPELFNEMKRYAEGREKRE